MAENWLHSNRRATWIGALPWFAVIIVGISLAAGWIGSPSWTVLRWMGAFLGVVGAVLMGLWLYATHRPRLSYDDGFLLVYLRVHRPLRIPIEIVECFFMGQGQSQLPGPAGRSVETANLIVRLAERANDWKQIAVHPVLGRWCDGYITIRGAWCEPLKRETVNRLNARLTDVQRDRKFGSQPRKEAV